MFSIVLRCCCVSVRQFLFRYSRNRQNHSIDFNSWIFEKLQVSMLLIWYSWIDTNKWRWFIFRHINGPFLVIGPKSTLRNWYNEVNRFCPSLKPLVLIGDKKERSEIVTQMGNSKEWDVLLTTYEICLQEKAALRRHRWQYLVVDEAHRLKNENSKLSTILRSLNTKNRLLLTGTPLQVCSLNCPTSACTWNNKWWSVQWEFC